jgi:hypothetical protein
LRAPQGNLFLQHLDSLVNFGLGGQGAKPEILGAYLDRVAGTWPEFPSACSR